MVPVSRRNSFTHRTSYVAVFAICLTLMFISLTCSVCAKQPIESSDQEYSQEQIDNTSAQVFLARMAEPEPGYHQFAAMWALTKKAKDANASVRRQILTLVTSAMYDTSRTVYQRYQCCYVISGSEDESWVPSLVDVLLNDPSTTMRAVAAEALGKFKDCAAAHDGLVQASKQEKDAQVIEAINRNMIKGDAKYTPEQINNTSAEVFIERMAKPEPGYHNFSAMWALIEKAKASDTKTRKEIMSLVTATMNDDTRVVNQRWECCYVISGCGDDTWVSDLINVLNSDPLFIMRSVAAEALGQFPDSNLAHNALVKAQRVETDQRVLDVIDRILVKVSTAH